MSVDAMGHIGPIETGPVSAVQPARRVNAGRTILVRPVPSTIPTESAPKPSLTNKPSTTREPIARGTAYQNNTDGDSATFASKLASMTDSERAVLTRLKDRDAEVRTHEQAHLNAAGSLASGNAQYEYQSGPDGARYAVGGHVSVDTSPGSTPQETIAKAQRIKQASMAPANPSGADRAVAAKAMRMEVEARRTLNTSPSRNSTSATARINGASIAAGGSGSSGRTLDLIA